ncbi:hypothetical protein BC827DRAFT_1154748 [Russula dissimulans]|nr:hypothetical protein BC827DRAFT_1154748 [Russula dissimulans]
MKRFGVERWRGNEQTARAGDDDRGGRRGRNAIGLAGAMQRAPRGLAPHSREKTRIWRRWPPDRVRDLISLALLSTPHTWASGSRSDGCTRFPRGTRGAAVQKKITRPNRRGWSHYLSLDGRAGDMLDESPFHSPARPSLFDLRICYGAARRSVRQIEGLRLAQGPRVPYLVDDK